MTKIWTGLMEFIKEKNWPSVLILGCIIIIVTLYLAGSDKEQAKNEYRDRCEEEKRQMELVYKAEIKALNDTIIRLLREKVTDQAAFYDKFNSAQTQYNKAASEAKKRDSVLDAKTRRNKKEIEKVGILSQ